MSEARLFLTLIGIILGLLELVGHCLFTLAIGALKFGGLPGLLSGFRCPLAAHMIGAIVATDGVERQGDQGNGGELADQRPGRREDGGKHQVTSV